MYFLCTLRLIFRIFRRGFASSILPEQSLVPESSIENEPLLEYLPGSEDLSRLRHSLERLSSNVTHVPIVIGDRELHTEHVRYQCMPHNHEKKVAKYYYATEDIINECIDTALQAREKWEKTPLVDRLAVFLRAADLIAGKYRMDLNAATIIGQSKTIVQAEIDSAAELVDFLRFNAYFANRFSKYQPISENPETTLNSLRMRGIEGFTAAITPFNFTAIGGNLATAPAMMGNVVMWKPSDAAMLSNYLIYKVLREAGLPSGVINFVPAEGVVFGNTIVNSPHLSILNFTGSVRTFQHLWSLIGSNIGIYNNYPRLIGECGGKNYHFVHYTANVDSVVMGTIRSAFEYGGQKCSACSRMYVPRSLWPQIRSGLVDVHKKIKFGNPAEVENFFGAVIDEKAFDRIKFYIDYAVSAPHIKLVAGGTCDKSKGYFIEPTILETELVDDRLMCEEVFGPLLTVYVYDDAQIEETLDAVSRVRFGLTGAVFANDREFLSHALHRLKMTAGNFYINDKSTGSVVGQQPFGGARISGTNDKAGGPHYMLKFCSPQSIKETFVPLTAWKYPYMGIHN